MLPSYEKLTENTRLNRKRRVTALPQPELEQRSGNVAVASTHVTSGQDDGRSGSELMIDPSLTTLPNAASATIPSEEERHQEDLMPRVHINGNEPIHSAKAAPPVTSTPLNSNNARLYTKIPRYYIVGI